MAATHRLLGILGVLGSLASGASGQDVVRVAPVPSHSIGLDEDSLFFDRISAVAALPGGELVVAEIRLGQVRLIDPARATAALVGGRGGGPAEFRFPADVGGLPGGFWVHDFGSVRMTVFDDAGRVEQTFRTPPLADGAAALLAGGVIAGTPRTKDPEESAPRWLRLFDAGDGVARDSIPLEQPPRRIHLQSGTVDLHSIQFWSDHTLWKTAPDGSGIVVVERPTSGPPEIIVRWYDPGGGLQATVRLGYEPFPITRDHVRRFTESLSTTLLDPRNRFNPSIDRKDFSPSAIARQLYVPDRLPPVSSVTVGRDGEVYLRRKSLDEDADEVEYWIVDPSGLLGTTALPVDFRPMSADRNGLWGVRKDELDRQYLVHYRLQHAPWR